MLLQSLEGAAAGLTKVPTDKQIQAVPPAPEEIVEKDGKVYVKTPDGKLVVAEDRASGQVTVSGARLCMHFRLKWSSALNDLLEKCCFLNCQSCL